MIHKNDRRMILLKEYPYIKVLGSIKKFMTFIQTSGVPDKLTQQKLPAYGFKSTNERALVGILKFIGFINSEGIPTDNWKAYRNKERAGAILAKSIKEGYSELFNIYPDAHSKDNEAIRNFFTGHTSVGQQVITAMTSTFRTLCELASFDKLSDDFEHETMIPQKEALRSDEQSTNGFDHMIKQTTQQGIALNINIELHLPATLDGEIYEKLFQALKKHLLQG
jgi:hypothetical protein